MFFFLSHRQTPHGTIEPDILPSSSSTRRLLTPKVVLSAYRTYITTWDFSDRPAILRHLACMLALLFHLPLNVICIVSEGISLWMFVGVVLSVTNFLCVGAAMWMLDIMWGERRCCGWLLTRRNFDYVILGLALFYGEAFAVMLFTMLSSGSRRWFFFVRIVWPCLIATDVFCFIAAWVATRRDVSFD